MKKTQTAHDADESTADEAQRRAPIYAQVTDVLRRAIVEQRIAPGAVLLESHVAELLRSTRTPVRQALRELELEGLVSRFEGRGFLAGPEGVPPLRIALTAQMMDRDPQAPVRKTPGWEAIYDLVEHDVVHLSVFGSCRINELELARHFEVSRMVARDVLLRLEVLGLAHKDERQRWSVTPLDADRISHLYELRWLLEPAALASVMASDRRALVAPMIEDAQRVLKAYPRIGAPDLHRLEHDLHVKLLSHCPNPELLRSLERTRCLLTMSKHVLGDSVPLPPRESTMAEHLAVLRAVAEGDVGAAQQLLREHLEISCRKLIERLEQVRAVGAVARPPYVA